MSGISGVLIELAAIGNQDSYLNIRPRLTLFRGSYRRITNFAWCPIEQTFASVAFGGTTNAALPRAGDLVAQMYVRALVPAGSQAQGAPGPSTTLPQNNILVNGAGFALCNEAELSIGGYPFDKHSGMFMFLWNQLSHKPCAQETVSVLQGNTYDLAQWTSTVGAGPAPNNFANYAAGQPLFVPMQFWFNRYYAQSLPMIALQYHEVKFSIRFGSADDLSGTGLNAATKYVPNPAVDLKASLVINYIFLDTVERRLFAATPHEYLIDQVHMPDGTAGVQAAAGSGVGVGQMNYQPIVNHPVKEFIWAFRLPISTVTPVMPTSALSVSVHDLHGSINVSGALGALRTTNWGNDTFTTMQMMLNGNDRLSVRVGDAAYYREVVPREVHSSVASENGYVQANTYTPQADVAINTTGRKSKGPLDTGFQVYNYSFAVDPEDWKPSGSCNFSRIDTVSLKFTGLSHSTLFFFYRNFNVMKIVAGMAGLRYAN